VIRFSKVKFVPFFVMKAYGGSIHIAPLILELISALDSGERSASYGF